MTYHILKVLSESVNLTVISTVVLSILMSFGLWDISFWNIKNIQNIEKKTLKIQLEAKKIDENFFILH